MKGIVLAGGSGSRLLPMTSVISKQLLPVYNKPLIYYPLSTLMMAGIQEILIITDAHNHFLFEKLLHDGSQWGIQISYAIQDAPNGIAEAFIIAEEFIAHDNITLVLGDNIFYGTSVIEKLKQHYKQHQGAYLFACQVKDPQRFGVIQFDHNGGVDKIIEKPLIPPSEYAITGLYVYDNQVVKLAKTLSPSARNELEITDLNNLYLQQRQLEVALLDDVVWFDTGTSDGLLQAAQWVQAYEHQHNKIIACLEAIALQYKWIETKHLLALISSLHKNHYGQYILALIENHDRNSNSPTN